MADRDKIIVYEKTSCSKCHIVNSILKEAGVSYSVVTYHTDPISPEKLKELIQKMDIDIKELVRTNEEEYKKLALKTKNLSFDELVEVLTTHPNLLQRPIVEKGNRAILARPPEKVKTLL